MSTPDTDPTPRAPRAPAGLSTRGRRLWRRVTERYELTIEETELCELAARSLDRISALEEALKGAKALVEGSQGQPRPNPLMAELRSEVALAARLLVQLGLPDEDAETDQHGSWQGLTPSERGRKAAGRRWAGRGNR